MRRTLAAAATVASVIALAAHAGAGARPPAVEITIAATGDLLIHAPVWLRATGYGHGGFHDFRPMFARIRPIIRSADLALCHVETPVDAGALSGYPRFNAPPGLALAIRWTGWDLCTTASNHTLDRGQSGIGATLAALDLWHVRHVGSARTRAERRRTPIVDAGGNLLSNQGAACGPATSQDGLIALIRVRRERGERAPGSSASTTCRRGSATRTTSWSRPARRSAGSCAPAREGARSRASSDARTGGRSRSPASARAPGRSPRRTSSPAARPCRFTGGGGLRPPEPPREKRVCLGGGAWGKPGFPHAQSGLWQTASRLLPSGS